MPGKLRKDAVESFTPPHRNHEPDKFQGTSLLVSQTSPKKQILAPQAGAQRSGAPKR
jgi:hypothetical protein